MSRADDVFVLSRDFPQKKSKKKLQAFSSHGHQASCDCGVFMCGKRGSGNYSFGADFVSKIKMLSVTKTVVLSSIHHSNSAKWCKSVLNITSNLCWLLLHDPFCQRWLVTAGKCFHPDSVLDIILLAQSEEVNMGEKLALVILVASPSVESRLHSAENLVFYLSILIFHCSHELFRVGIVSTWVIRAYHRRFLALGH